MNKLLRATLFASCFALHACSGSDEATEKNIALMHACPLFNGSYGPEGSATPTLTIQTKVEDEKYSYSFSDLGGVFFEADIPPLTFNGDSSIQLTCGNKFVTLHARSSGVMRRITYTDLGGGDSLQVYADGNGVVLHKLAELPKKEDPDHPAKPPTGEGFCPVLNGHYASADGSIDVELATDTKFGDDGVYAYKVGGLDDQFRAYTRGKSVTLATVGYPSYETTSDYSVNCNAGNWLNVTFRDVYTSSYSFTATVGSDGSLEAEIVKGRAAAVKTTLRPAK